MDNRCIAYGRPELVGDPVDTLTGAVVDRTLDFRLTGPIELRWHRYYDSSRSGCVLSAGRGWAHEFDRRLTLTAEGFRYEEPLRCDVVLPRIAEEGGEAVARGFRLRQTSARRYELFSHPGPTMEFVFHGDELQARLARLVRGPSEVRFGYDGAGRLASMIDSAGRRLTATEDDLGRLVRLAVAPTATRPGYLLVAYHYDECDNLIRTENDQGHGYRYSYDASNRLVLRRGRKGFQFYFTYDTHGRCVRSVGDDLLYGVALQYVVPGHVTKVTRPDGGVWTYLFSTSGALQEVHDPLGGVHKLVRDATDRPALEIDPLGGVSKFVYNSAGAAVTKIDPVGHRFTLPEDPNAPDPMAPVLPLNAAEYEYGRLMNVDGIVLPEVAALKRLTGASAWLGAVATASPENVPSRPAFDVPPLRVLWWPPPRSGRVFNDLGKLLEQRDLFGRVRRWTYDESGNAADYVDFDGGLWRFDYGAWHFRRGLTNPLGQEIRYTYTPYGGVASFTDAGGTGSEYRYDECDRLIEVRRHGVVRETYSRDAAGNLVAKHGANGRELLRIEVGRGGLPLRRTLASGDEHHFEYDGAGRTLVAATRHGRVEFAYDLLGNGVRDKREGLGVEHRFQGWRRLAETVVFDRFVVRYAWRGRTLTIADPTNRVHTVHFLGNGLVERQFSNGSREISQYDNLGRCLLKLADRKRAGAWTRRYQWSGEGELTRVQDDRRGEVRHEFDAAHRLRSRCGHGRNDQFEFDAASNLIAQPGLTDVRLAAGNRLATANGDIFHYDDRNHVAVRQNRKDATRYHYDSRDQLVLVDTPSGQWQADYDALGRRTRKTFSGGTVEYYWSGDQLIAERQDDGRIRIYVYADTLALVPLLFLDYASIDAPTESGLRYFVFSDQIGAPIVVEDDLGSEVWSAVVAPFGHARVAPDAKLDLNLRLPGHYCDPELGLHYNRFRHYDPVLGRFLQSDPAGISGGHNLYAYHPNPLLSADVMGLGEDGANCRSREDGAEGTGDPNAPPRRRMTDEELQAAADYIRHGGGPRPDDWSTLTVTEGTGPNGPVYTVTSSRGPSDANDGHNLTPGERGRAAQVFGPDVNTPPEARAPAGDNSHHAEQRGMRATEDQTDRRQASSNQTGSTRRDPDVGHMGAACAHCGTAQQNATNSQGEANPVQNVTGTIDDGGRTNNPRNPGAWRGWSNE